VRLEESGKLKKLNDLIGNRTRHFPARSIVPQPTTLPRDTYIIWTCLKINMICFCIKIYMCTCTLRNNLESKYTSISPKNTKCDATTHSSATEYEFVFCTLSRYPKALYFMLLATSLFKNCTDTRFQPISMHNISLSLNKLLCLL
jgi:hypothetical protein